ncbi:MAG TPA: type VI secretion system baseplate subunit TssE [Blastocatellia bacterium]|jgi:type VI secretion system protein ImpF
MPKADNEIRIIPSVLDRLLDYEPEKSREPAASRSRGLLQVKDSVKRNLVWLLNTRYVPQEVPSDLKEVNESLAVYGLPDFSTASIKNPADRNRLRAALEHTIKTFEPRLGDVTVTIEPMRDGERALRFRVNARLMVKPSPEPVTFDTMLQLGSGEYIVQGE